MDDIDEKLRRMRFESKERKKKSQKLVRKANKKLKKLEEEEKLWGEPKSTRFLKYDNPENHGEP